MFRAFVEKLRQSQWYASATGLFLIYFLLGSAPALTVANVDIDPSWQAFLADAFAQQRMFGRDLVFTYGPLGHWLAGGYLGQNLGLLCLSRLVYGAAVAFMLALAARSLPPIPRLLFTACYVLVNPLDWALLAPALFGLWLLTAVRPHGYWLVSGTFCAALGLVKFNYFIYYACLYVVFTLAAWLAGRRRSALVAGLSFPVWLLLFWGRAAPPWASFGCG